MFFLLSKIKKCNYVFKTNQNTLSLILGRWKRDFNKNTNDVRLIVQRLKFKIDYEWIYFIKFNLSKSDLNVK